MTQTPEQAVLALIREAIQGTEWENQVFIAGGYVRDEILGRQSKDIDLVITRENGGLEFAHWITKRFKCNTTGNPVVFPRFGTAKFHIRATVDGMNLGDVQIEAVMPRTETYIEGSRKPDVGFTSLEEDAKRRDFTVNSLFRNVSTGEIVDFTDGVNDIQHGIIRTAIAAEIIFKDDPLRMLRVFRFATRFEWEVDPMLIYSVVQHAPRIQSISKERIADELVKILMSDEPRIGFLGMWYTGLLDFILPDLARQKGVMQNDYHHQDVFDHIMTVVENCPFDARVRLMALFHDIGKADTRSVGEDGRVHFYKHEEVGAEIAERVLEELRFPRSTINSVVKGVREHMRLKGAGMRGEVISDKALRKLREDLGSDFDMILDLMHADNISHAPEHNMPDQIPGIRQRFETLYDRPPKVELPINGNDVMQELGIKPGPAVKAALEKVKDAWFENPNLTRDEALQIIRV